MNDQMQMPNLAESSDAWAGILRADAITVLSKQTG